MLSKITKQQLTAEFVQNEAASVDAAHNYTLTIHQGQETITTDFFDLNNPPDFLIDLLTLIQQLTEPE